MWKIEERCQTAGGATEGQTETIVITGQIESVRVPEIDLVRTEKIRLQGVPLAALSRAVPARALCSGFLCASFGDGSQRLAADAKADMPARCRRYDGNAGRKPAPQTTCRLAAGAPTCLLLRHAGQEPNTPIPTFFQSQEIV
jgi:hypothetical protein